MNTSPPPTAQPAPTPAASYLWRFANAAFDESKSELRVNDEVVAIEPRPLRLLAELLHHTNEVVTKEELFEVVWEGRVTVDNVLANALTKLRRALGAEAGGRIVNVPRVGYRLTGAVERVAVGEVAAVPLGLQAGHAVPGRPGFLLLKALGSTGRGNVWLARHAKTLRERVFKFATDANSLRSLKREFTLSRLLKAELGERPEFVAVLDANFADAPYWLECEVGGADLLQWAADGGHLQAMGVEERIALFVGLAQAVGDAHGVGVLHKDLKPANVLVSGTPGAWSLRLTDFGSGHATQGARLHELGLTALGMTVNDVAAASAGGGTPLYLAPEVLAGHGATAQSDVYALGVLLYQWVVGDFKRPMATGWERDVADEVLCQDISQATQGMPGHRLASAALLAERLRQLPERRAQAARQRAKDEAIELAAAELARERARRPWVVAALGSLAVGFAASLWFFVGASQSAAQAKAAAARAQLISSFYNRDVLQAADETLLGPGKTLQMTQLLQMASERAATRFEADPQSQAEVRAQLGRLMWRTGAFAQAKVQYEQSAALYERAGMAATVDYVVGRYLLAEVNGALVRSAETAELIQQADEMTSNLRLTEVPEVQLAAARAKSVFNFHHARFDVAKQHSLAAVKLVDNIEPNNLGERFLQRRALSEVYFRLGDTNAMQAVVDELLSPPYSPAIVGEVAIAAAQLQLGKLKTMQGKPSEAVPLLMQARSVYERRLGEENDKVRAASEELGIALQDQEMYEEAAKAFDVALRISRTLYGDDHQATRVYRVMVALARGAGGQFREALGVLDAEQPWFARQAGEHHRRYAQHLDFFRVRLLLDLGLSGRADALLTGLDERVLQLASPDRYWPAMLATERGRLKWLTSRSAQALQEIAAALVTLRERKTPEAELRRYERLLAEAKAPR